MFRSEVGLPPKVLRGSPGSDATDPALIDRHGGELTIEQISAFPWRAISKDYRDTE